MFIFCIGCSIVRYQGAENSSCALLVCNYNVGNMIDIASYEVGPYTWKCATGPNPFFPGLCDEKEDFSTHKFAELFFVNKSPVVAEWVKRHKQINTGGAVIQYTNNTEKIV